jgi:hypothetical protein
MVSHLARFFLLPDAVAMMRKSSAMFFQPAIAMLSPSWILVPPLCTLAVLLTTTLLGISFYFFLSGFKDVENGALYRFRRIVDTPHADSLTPCQSVGLPDLPSEDNVSTGVDFRTTLDM